ncbi:MAG: hypothetical protein J0G28_01210 [Afipia sp.]|nr:hypothetical protein [Afipia sp.]
MAPQFLPLLLKLHHAVFASGPPLPQDDMPCKMARADRLEAMMIATAQGNTECLPFVMTILERNERAEPKNPDENRHAEFI